jgi:hypothetical protein
VQALGGAAEVQLFRDRDEITQLTKLHETDSPNDSIELNNVLDTITAGGVALPGQGVLRTRLPQLRDP